MTAEYGFKNTVHRIPDWHFTPLVVEELIIQYSDPSRAYIE